MRSVILSAVAITAAAQNPSCEEVSTCVAYGMTGMCVSASSGCCSGNLASGFCPGPADIQCCTEDGGTDDGPDFGDSPYYYDNWCGDHEAYALRYLDDRYCNKKFPSQFDREWVCPSSFDDANLEGFSADAALGDVDVNVDILPGIVTNNANICLILTRRQNGKPYHKYFCNGETSKSEPHETWSSSKIFAMANAGGKLRTECSSAGLDAATTGKHGITPFGDLSTVVCSYDTTAGYSSNSLSSYFHDLGWRDRIFGLVTGGWLGRGGESLGGNYGEASPSDLGFDVICADSSQCGAVKDKGSPYTNTISTLSAAEMTRRIVQYREIPEAYRFPNATWTDMQSIMYGAETSALFPSVSWGGMAADTAIYLQSALDMSDVQASSNGEWRIFSKLGAGYSSSRSVGEIINNAYACLPVLNENNEPVLNAGFELTISVRGSIPGDTSLSEADNTVVTAVRETIDALLAGKLV